MKQTGVKWLEEELKANLKKVILEGNSELMESLFKQAKEMEKQQIIDAYIDGCNNGLSFTGSKLIKTSEQYYNETFKK